MHPTLILHFVHLVFFFFCVLVGVSTERSLPAEPDVGGSSAPTLSTEITEATLLVSDLMLVVSLSSDGKPASGRTLSAAARDATTVDAVASFNELLIALLICVLIELLLLLLLFTLFELELEADDEPAGGACLRFMASLKHFEHIPSVAGLP